MDHHLKIRLNQSIIHFTLESVKYLKLNEINLYRALPL